MAEREPLTGWTKMRQPYRGWTHEMRVGPFELEAGPGGWRIGDAIQLVEAGVTTPADIRTAQLAAEDAARVLGSDPGASDIRVVLMNDVELLRLALRMLGIDPAELAARLKSGAPS